MICWIMTGNYYAHLGYYDTYCRINVFRNTILYYDTRSSGQFLGEFTVNICKKTFFYFEKKSKSALEHLK